MRNRSPNLSTELSLKNKERLAELLRLFESPFVFEEFCQDQHLRRRVVGAKKADGLPIVTYTHPPEGLFVESWDRRRALWEILLPGPVSRFQFNSGELTSKPVSALKAWFKLVEVFGLIESRLREVEVGCLLFHRKRERLAIWVQNSPPAPLQVGLNEEWEGLADRLARGTFKKEEVGPLLGSRSAMFYFPLPQETDLRSLAGALKNSLNSSKHALEAHPDSAWDLS